MSGEVLFFNMATLISNNNHTPLIGSSESRTEVNRHEEELLEMNVLRNPNVFLLIKTESKLSAISPFLIDKSLQAIAGGNLKSVKKLRTGELLVETENGKQAKRLMKAEKLGTLPIKTNIHKTLNSCRGVITVDELVDVSDKDILEGLRDELVTNVRRICIRRDGNQLPTRSIILTFASRKLPTSIKVGYLNCPVRPYVPNPMRCFKCQRYGHSQPSCRSSSIVCARCSEIGHDSKECNKEVKCFNCKGPHASYSRECEVWKD